MLRTACRSSAHVDSVVVGGGPAGIAVLGSLLQHGDRKQRRLWVDPLFRAGRVNAAYRRVPSNTKVDLFAQFATALAPFQSIVEEAQAPNAFTALKDLPQDQGCELSKAADLCLMLTEGLKTREGVHPHQGQVTAASFSERTNFWTVTLDGKEQVETNRLVLCTGSSPIQNPLPILRSSAPDIPSIHLDTALNPPLLAKTLDKNTPETVAVIGASHSAILVLLNLFNLASTTHPDLRIRWFTRHKTLRYAVYKDGWILYDNTGLKGQAAEWARKNLDEGVFASSPVSKVVTKFWTSPTEEEHIYRTELPGCTHVVQAIGYQRDPLPTLTVAGNPEPLSLEHDGLTGRFLRSGGRQYMPGLFGAGIAFPERVTDPMGNVEHAVGFWKFMKFCNRVVPEWIGSTEEAKP